MSNVQAMLGLAKYAGPTTSGGGYNDMSLLLNPGMGSGANLMSNERHRSQFSLHCIMAANMLMTGNLSSLAPYALQTWSNEEAIAVNQDAAALPFQVLQAEPAAAGLSSGSSSSGYTGAVVQECGGEVAAQNWTFGAPAPQFLLNAASSQCLNVESCKTALIYDGCTTSGSTCSGPHSYANEQWVLTAEGALQSQLPGQLCATAAADRSVGLQSCGSPLLPGQQWSYSAGTGQLQTGSGLCLTVPPPGPQPSNSSALLLGRRLQGGSVALLALNNAPEAADIVCGSACFAALGLAPSVSFVVRDLWLHADIAHSSAAVPLNITVQGAGASVLLKLTPS
jgi:hypothetical protein